MTRSVHAHLFDVYPVRGGMAVWLLADDGSRLRLVHSWAPRFYCAGRWDALRQASALLRALRAPVTVRPAVRYDLLRGDVAVAEVTVTDPLVFPRVVTRLARLDDLVFYNCDIGLPQMYLYEHRLFPLGRCAVDATPDGMIREIAPLDSPWDQEYTVPPLTVLRLRLEGDPANPNHGHRAILHVAVDGEESGLTGETPADLLASLSRWLHRYDPDILLTEWGDSFLFPRLRRLAALSRLPLPLSRDPQAGTRTRRPRSYMTYGQIVYTAGGSYLHGRWHLDTTNSFTYEEAELPGLFELSRLGRLPVQHAARTSVGTVITSMQLDQAYQDGILIPWRKSRPEAFKSAGDLLLTDRGGLTYMPLVGAYGHVGELDFAAMYPAIMTRFNISQETVNCSCCREDPASRVPGIPHHLCRRRRGLIPRVLARVLERRAYYKERRAATTGDERHVYNMRQTALKWVGVVCLDGNTLVPYRQKGRWRAAPIREIVEAHLPGESAGVRQVEGLSVIGVDETLQTCLKPVTHVIKAPAPTRMIQVKLRWNRELLMTPDHLNYVLQDGQLHLKRADQLKRGDWIPIVTSWERLMNQTSSQINLIAALKNALPITEQERWRVFEPPQSSLSFVHVTAIEEVPYAERFVYCVELQDDPAAFAVAGGILTHNCFGYQGYKNARFGQIEAHECTTALSREMLLRAKEVAEAEGYRMLHALVDSVWLQKPGATRADYEALARMIVEATELPIAVEGVYRWIAFVPSRTHPLVGVPNRFFGVFEDGTSKVRGIELRRGDTPPLVAAMQSRMLAVLFQTATLEEARAQIPAVMDLLHDELVRLRQHEVRPEELVIRTVLSQDPREYEKGVPQAVAAHQLLQAGATLHPGEAIEYIITNAASRIPGERAVAYACLPGDWSYDEERYARMLRRATETLLTPFRRPTGSAGISLRPGEAAGPEPT